MCPILQPNVPERTISVKPPFIGLTKQNQKVFVRSKISGLFGPDSWSCTPLDDASENLQLGMDEITPLIEPTKGPEGEILRFLLADRWLDRGGATGTSLALRANINFEAFQIRPLLKFNGSAEQRMLIADETGLGKTVEAGMIIAEVLAAKGDEASVVILCPASIKWKWVMELRKKFGIYAHATNFNDFNENSIPKGVSVITHGASPGEDTIPVPNESIDLLVIDEVHRFIGRQGNQKRRGRALGLSNAAKAVIGLSATPVQLHENDLCAILELIAPNQHSEEIFSEQSALQKAVNRVMVNQRGGLGCSETDIELLNRHWPDGIALEPNDLLKPLPEDIWSPVELDFQSIGPIGRRMTRARGRDPDVNKFRERIIRNITVGKGEHSDLINAIDEHIHRNRHHANRQQFASCPGAALTILRPTSVDSEDWWDEAPIENEATTIEINELIHRVELEMPNGGPKCRVLCDLLDDLSEREDVTRAVVFTHWMPTLSWLSKSLLATRKHEVFVVRQTHDSREAAEVIAKFSATEGFAVLIVSDKMSEGIDLDKANVVINMDLPYNPAVLQQRIGRLDRIIQESAFIEVHNLVLEDSIEEDIIEILKERVEIFQGIIGDAEHIITEEEPARNDEDAASALAKIREGVIVDRLAESDILLRVMDSSLDGIIGARRREIHPLHARLHLIVRAAMERLGAETEWNEDEGEIRIRLDGNMRKQIIESRAFLPWGIDEMMAAFQGGESENHITIPMRGKYAVLGPLHPFLYACESLLWHVEGMGVTNDNHCDTSLIGSMDEDQRWALKKNGILTEIATSKILNLLTKGKLVTNNWSVHDSKIIAKRVSE